MEAKLIAKRRTNSDGTVDVKLEMNGEALGILVFPNPLAWGKVAQCFRLGAEEIDGFEFMIVGEATVSPPAPTKEEGDEDVPIK